MDLADHATVDTALAVIIVPAKYDSAGSLIPGMPVVTLYVIEALPSSCVLGMLFLSGYNPIIDRSRRTVTFVSLLVIYLPQQPTVAVEL